MKNQTGYTIVELFTAIFGLAVLAVVGWLIYAAIHFILKFW